MTLVLPNLQGKQRGLVITTITVTNRIDLVMAERRFLTAEEVRSVTLDNVVVDTGATMLSLPAHIISQLGLRQVGEREVETSAGIKKNRIFAGAQIMVEGREGRFDCLELPEGILAVLLGVTPMQQLGLSRWVQINSRWGGRVLPSKTGWYQRFLAKPAPTKYYGFFAMTYLLTCNFSPKFHSQTVARVRSRYSN